MICIIIFNKRLDEALFDSVIRVEAGIKVKLIFMDNKDMVVNWQNCINEMTIFGMMRKTILNFQDKLRDDLFKS